MASRRILTIAQQAIGNATTIFQLQGLRGMRTLRIWPKRADQHLVEVRSRRLVATDAIVATLQFSTEAGASMTPVEMPWVGDDARIAVIRQLNPAADFEAEVEWTEDVPGPIVPVIAYAEERTLGVGEGMSPTVTAIQAGYWSRVRYVAEASDTAQLRHRYSVQGTPLGFLVLATLAANVPQVVEHVLALHRFEPNLINTGAAGNVAKIAVRLLP